MAYDFKKIKDLGIRVYNNKMIVDEKTGISDEKDIMELCSRTFGNGTQTPDPSMLHQFNNIIVETANEVAKPRIEQIINFVANYKSAMPGDVVLYKVPQNHKVKVAWSALGTGVDLIRLGGKKQVPAVGKAMQFGAYYEPLDMVRDSVDAFRTAVDEVANAKVQLYFEKISEVTQTAITNSVIPANNVKDGTNLTLTDFRKLESTLGRYGGRPVFLADSLLIDHFAQLLLTEGGYKELLTDDLRKMLLSDLQISQLSKSVAVTLVNPFTDKTNTKVGLDPAKGYMFAGGANNAKPFYITEFGGMRQYTEQDPEDERIKLKITQEADITLLNGEAMGYVHDDSITLL